MTGTACEVCVHDETETRFLNRFDLLSLWLFEKINNDHLQAEDLPGCESILNGNESMKTDVAVNDRGLKGL